MDVRETHTRSTAGRAARAPRPGGRPSDRCRQHCRLIEVAAARPGLRILNSADPDTPSAAEIARIIAAQLGHRWEEVLLDDTAPEGLGETPWDLRHPIVLDSSAAERLGYKPDGDYESTVAAEVEWLVAAAQGRAGADAVPADDDPFFARLLDYEAEDAYLARHG